MREKRYVVREYEYAYEITDNAHPSVTAHVYKQDDDDPAARRIARAICAMLNDGSLK